MCCGTPCRCGPLTSNHCTTCRSRCWLGCVRWPSRTPTCAGRCCEPSTGSPPACATRAEHRSGGSSAAPVHRVALPRYGDISGFRDAELARYVSISGADQPVPAGEDHVRNTVVLAVVEPTELNLLARKCGNLDRDCETAGSAAGRRRGAAGHGGPDA